MLQNEICNYGVYLLNKRESALLEYDQLNICNFINAIKNNFVSSFSYIMINNLDAIKKMQVENCILFLKWTGLKKLFGKNILVINFMVISSRHIYKYLND